MEDLDQPAHPQSDQSLMVIGQPLTVENWRHFVKPGFLELP